MTKQLTKAGWIEAAFLLHLPPSAPAAEFLRRARQADASGKGESLEAAWRSACQAVKRDPNDGSDGSFLSILRAMEGAELQLSRGPHNPVLADAERRARAARGDDAGDGPFDARSPEEAIALSHNPVLKDAVNRRDQATAGGNVVLADARRRAEAAEGGAR